MSGFRDRALDAIAKVIVAAFMIVAGLFFGLMIGTLLWYHPVDSLKIAAIYTPIFWAMRRVNRITR
jgi:TM2 domain-containing membrane protein YozV